MDTYLTPSGSCMPCPRITVGVLFLRRKRAGFDPEWGAVIEERALADLAQSPFSVVVPDVRIVDDASLRASLTACEAAGCDVLIAIQPTMSDGRMAAVLGQLASAPVVFWATPEKQEGSMISACSLVGAHTFGATLAQVGHPFEFAYGMPGEPEAGQDLRDAVRVAYTAGRLRKGRAALVGYHAPGFIDMHADPNTLNQCLGVQLHHASLREFTDAIQAVPEGAAKQDVSATLELGLPLDGVSESELELASRYYLMMRQMMDEESLDALAVRDWPELSDIVGQWPYLAMARLGAEGVAIGCEGDVDGALSCMIGTALGCGACYLSDWLEHDRDKITLWHGGNAPFQLCEPVGDEGGPSVARHFNNKRPAVVNARLKTGIPITLFRLWHCDGEYRMTAFEGETVPPPRHLLGTYGTGYFPAVAPLNDWFRNALQLGFPHHPIVVEGNWTGRLERLARIMDITWC